MLGTEADSRASASQPDPDSSVPIGRAALAHVTLTRFRFRLANCRVVALVSFLAVFLFLQPTTFDRGFSNIHPLAAMNHCGGRS
jgi:hypothetical protein